MELLDFLRRMSHQNSAASRINTAILSIADAVLAMARHYCNDFRQVRFLLTAGQLPGMRKAKKDTAKNFRGEPRSLPIAGQVCQLVAEGVVMPRLCWHRTLNVRPSIP
jgi:hypothetical protein